VQTGRTRVEKKFEAAPGVSNTPIVHSNFDISSSGSSSNNNSSSASDSSISNTDQVRGHSFACSSVCSSVASIADSATVNCCTSQTDNILNLLCLELFHFRAKITHS
jgi:hypothetical protein